MSWALPISALLRRELLTQLRRKRAFALLLMLCLFMVWSVAIAWPRGMQVTWFMLPSVTQGLLSSIAFMLLIGSGLFIPGVAATTIVSEKDERSWDLLALTMLRPFGIITGKLLSAVGLYLLFIVAVFPIIAVVFFLIGIDWVQMTLSLVVVIMTSITCAAVGMACSAWMRRTAAAVATSYLGMVMVMGLPALIIAGALAALSVVMRLPSFPLREAFLVAASPLAVLAGLTFGAGSFGGISTATLFLYHAVYQCVITAGALLLTVVALRRPDRPAVLPVAVVSEDARTGPPSLRGRRRVRRRFRNPRRPIPDSMNPVLARELWWGGADSRRLYISATMLMFGISWILGYMVDYANFTFNAAGYTALALHGILVCCLIPGRLAGMFTKELELRCVDLLHMTLMRPQEIVRARFLVGVRLAAGLTLCSLLSNMFLLGKIWFHDGPLVHVLAGHGTLFICALIVACLSLCASVLSKRTSVAVVSGFGAGLFVFFGGPMLLMMIYETFSLRWAEFDLIAVSLSPVLPYFYYVTQPRSWPFAPYLEVLWAVNSVLFLLFCFVVYEFTRRFYARRRMRAR